MKTERQQPLPPLRDDILLAEEVLIMRRTHAPARMLLVPALLTVTEFVHRKEQFEIRRLNQDLLCTFDGENYTGRIEILTVLRPVADYMNQFSHKLGAAVAHELKPVLRAQILQELDAATPPRP